jgi:putative restriction endonuclease
VSAAIPNTPRLSKSQLLDRIILAIRTSGWDVLIISPAGEHPVELNVFSGDTKLLLLCYIWNLTHGGYPRDPNELRIQITGVDEIELREGDRTLLLGWSEPLGVFAGFDATKHQIPMAGRSPSLQIRREALEKAGVNGFYPQSRGNDEIAVAFRPDFFIPYVLQADELHRTTAAASEARILEKVAKEEPGETELSDIPAGERKQVLQTFTRKVRDARFRRNVLHAYSHRCCLCGLQLDLLDAAHIIPVEHEKGTDEIKNGLSLCALHHRAFDHALVGVRRDYAVVHNDKQFTHLRRIGWDGGEAEFKAALRDQVLLPPRKAIYPDPDYLVFGQELRGWSSRVLS